MDRHDQELLDKQLRGLGLPRNDSVVVLTVIMVFFVGIAFGAALTPPKNARAQTASMQAPTAVASMLGRPQDLR